MSAFGFRIGAELQNRYHRPMATRTPTTREIGRSAVRDQLVRVAFPHFLEHGFDGVTFDALAREAGVSRSTFLRYFPGKEDVVLAVVDPLADAIDDALGTARENETEWRALRRGLEPVVAFLDGPEKRLDLMRLIWRTPALYSRLHEKQAAWRPRMVQRLADRPGPPSDDLSRRTRVAAALECLTVAIDAWLAADGRPGLGALLDRTFDAVRGLD